MKKILFLIIFLIFSQICYSESLDYKGLKKIMESNNLNFRYLEKKFEIDLKWNSLIFNLYRNRISVNLSEIDEQLKLSQIRL